MDHKLSVLVQIDLHGRYVRLVVTGRVTEASQHALHPVVARARSLFPLVAVTVDLTCAEHVDSAAADLLREAVDHGETSCDHVPLEILVPDRTADHRIVVPLTARTRTRPAPATRRTA